MAEGRTYTVECYSTAVDLRSVKESAVRAARAAADLRRGGDAVDYLGALLVPGDEVVFYLFRSPTSAAVREASSRAGITFERVLESVAVGLRPSWDPVDEGGRLAREPTSQGGA